MSVCNILKANHCSQTYIYPVFCHDEHGTCMHLQEGDTPVMMAVKSGNIQTLDVLLEAKCDVNTKNKVRGR